MPFKVNGKTLYTTFSYKKVACNETNLPPKSVKSLFKTTLRKYRRNIKLKKSEQRLVALTFLV